MSTGEFNPYEFANDPFAGERLAFCTRIVDLNTQLAAKDAEIAEARALLREADRLMDADVEWGVINDLHARIAALLERKP